MYRIVKDHFTVSNENLNGKPLLLLVRGIAGSGKSYVIDALGNLLQSKHQVLAYTGKAAFNVNSITLNSLLKLHISSRQQHDLKGMALPQLQDNLTGINYLIMDEYSFVSQNLFGWSDSHYRQANGKADQPFGGFSIILFGDIAQLSAVPKSEKTNYRVSNVL